MRDFMLILGCALMAFGPFLSLFSLIVYKKAQLVIVVTTSAFFFLLATLFASLVWYILDTIGLGGPLAAIIPGVFFQFVFRSVFVSLYHKVEAVIQASLDKQHQEEERECLAAAAASNTPRDGRGNDDVTEQSHAGMRRNSNGNSSDSSQENSGGSSNSTRNKSSWTEAAKLRLQLNDASCGIAAGVGYGGMHAILVYGTLLASEASHSSGVLYQQSCPAIPSLAVSGMFSFFFTILDVFWMLFTFFGMRRRLIYHRGGQAPNNIRAVGSWLGDSRTGGNLSLLFCLFSHTMASLVTLADYFQYGCRVSLPLLGTIVLITAYIFWAGVGRIYMPPNPTLSQLRRTQTPRGYTNADNVDDGFTHPQRRIA